MRGGGCESVGGVNEMGHMRKVGDGWMGWGCGRGQGTKEGGVNGVRFWVMVGW